MLKEFYDNFKIRMYWFEDFLYTDKLDPRWILIKTMNKLNKENFSNLIKVELEKNITQLKKGYTMDLESLYGQMKEYFEQFEEMHNQNMNGKKAAAGKARKALGEVKKLVTPYRQASVEFNKK